MLAVRRRFEMYRLIEDAFRFLVDEHSFTRGVEGDASYISSALWVEPRHEPRDGYSTHLIFPRKAAQRVSVGTVLASLDVLRLSRNASWIRNMNQHASFIRLNLDKLLDLPDDVYHDLCALRFWHAVDWRQGWGTTIIMSGTIADEKARLIRMQRYFKHVPSNA
jgi:hypothetical protein